MRFWDSSALVPLLLEERTSTACRKALRADPFVAVWALTRTELISAVRRRERAGDLDAQGGAAAVSRIEGLTNRWTEVEALDQVRQRAERLLAVHPLRAADALQLGAALVLFDDRPRRRSFLTLDLELSRAAGREGFSVVVPA